MPVHPHLFYHLLMISGTVVVDAVEKRQEQALLDDGKGSSQ
jgi:hypothetical protein